MILLAQGGGCEGKIEKSITKAAPKKKKERNERVKQKEMESFKKLRAIERH